MNERVAYYRFVLTGGLNSDEKRVWDALTPEWQEIHEIARKSGLNAVDATFALIKVRRYGYCEAREFWDSRKTETYVII